MVQASDLTMRSGGPNSFVAFHSSAFGHCRGRGMSLRSPRGAPPSTHRTMVSTCALAERHVILEFLDSHGGANVPWRHLTGNHTLADRLRPGACLFVSRQRHRRHRPGVMALLALLLQNRCHVFGKGNAVGRQSDTRKTQADTSKQNDDRDLPAMKISVHAFT